MRLHFILVALSAFLATSSATTAFSRPGKAEDALRALVGTEYTPSAFYAPVAPDVSSCIYEGGTLLFIDGKSVGEWSKAIVRCGGRIGILLEKKVGEESSKTRWKVVDTLLLPPVAYGPDNPQNGRLTLYNESEGVCDVTPPPRVTFFALIRWKNREKIDGRNGVEKAWTFDIDKEKIIPMSTRNISCEWTEP